MIFLELFMRYEVICVTHDAVALENQCKVEIVIVSTG